jgi:hypothetical protein
VKPPFAQPEKSRVASITIAKSRVLAALVLRILSRKGFGTFFTASERYGNGRLALFGVKERLLLSVHHRRHIAGLRVVYGNGIYQHFWFLPFLVRARAFSCLRTLSWNLCSATMPSM